MGIIYDCYVARRGEGRLARDRLVALCEDLLYERLVATPLAVYAARSAASLPDPYLGPRRPLRRGARLLYEGSSDRGLLEAVGQAYSGALQVVCPGPDVRQPWNSGLEEHMQHECFVALCSFPRPQRLVVRHDAYLTDDDVAGLGLGEAELREELAGVHDYLRLVGKHAPEDEETLLRSRLGETLRQHFGELRVIVEAS